MNKHLSIPISECNMIQQGTLYQLKHRNNNKYANKLKNEF